MKKVNYMLEMLESDIFRNLSQINLGVLRQISMFVLRDYFRGFGCPNDTQTPCWLKDLMLTAHAFTRIDGEMALLLIEIPTFQLVHRPPGYVMGVSLLWIDGAIMGWGGGGGGVISICL